MTSPFRFRPAILFLLSLAPFSVAEEPVPVPGSSALTGNASPLSRQSSDVAAAPAPTMLSRISGLFDFELPRLDPPGTYKLIFHPHFGDFFNRGYIRTDVGFRWALNDHFGMDAAVGTYVTHGLRSEHNGYGVGQVRAGVKQVFKTWPKPEYETSIGFETLFPVDHPPIDMTDGLRHYTPSVAIEYRPPSHRRWTTFGGANIDFVSSTNIPGISQINTPRDDSLSFTTGAIYDLGQVKWTLQATYTTTALIGETTENFYSIRPSVLWYVPRHFSPITKTQWILGLGVNTTWGPDGFHISSSSRVRAEITFRQVMDKIRNAKSRE